MVAAVVVAEVVVAAVVVAAVVVAGTLRGGRVIGDSPVSMRFLNVGGHRLCLASAVFTVTTTCLGHLYDSVV